MIGNPKSPESRKARIEAIMARRKAAAAAKPPPTSRMDRNAKVQALMAQQKAKAAPPPAAAPRTTGPMDMPSAPMGMRPTASPRGYKKGGMIKGGGKACKTY